MAKKGADWWVSQIFGDWFKNITVLLLLIPGGFIVVRGLSKGWIDQNFAVELLFLIMGIVIGRWLDNGKK